MGLVMRAYIVRLVCVLCIDLAGAELYARAVCGGRGLCVEGEGCVLCVEGEGCMLGERVPCRGRGMCA